jgi:hypothetical protein
MTSSQSSSEHLGQHLKSVGGSEADVSGSAYVVTAEYTLESVVSGLRMKQQEHGNPASESSILHASAQVLISRRDEQDPSHHPGISQPGGVSAGHPLPRGPPHPGTHPRGGPGSRPDRGPETDQAEGAVSAPSISRPAAAFPWNGCTGVQLWLRAGLAPVGGLPLARPMVMATALQLSDAIPDGLLPETS